jgi:transcriptional regulator with XRE-family HTH domain
LDIKLVQYNPNDNGVVEMKGNVVMAQGRSTRDEASPVKRLSKFLQSHRPEGMPIDVLGRAIGVTNMTFHKYWHGKSKVIPLDFLQKVSTYFKVPITTLVAEITSERTPQELHDATEAKKRFAALYRYVSDERFDSMVEKFEKAANAYPTFFDGDIGTWFVEFFEVLFSLDISTLSDLELSTLSGFKEREGILSQSKVDRIKRLYAFKVKLLEGKV